MLATAFTGELTKLRRTIAPWVTLGSLMTGPVFLAPFLWTMPNPRPAAVRKASHRPPPVR